MVDTIHTYNSEFEMAVRRWAQERIEPDRQSHVSGVVESADRLARLFAPDSVALVRLAGWIHDAAKHLPDEVLLNYAQNKGLPVSEYEQRVPMLLHGLVGYTQADEQFVLNDRVLQSACALHTTGAPGMSITDKIVFLADMIEPTRSFPGVEILRAEAERHLDSAVLLAADYTLKYLLLKQKTIDPRLLYLRNELLDAGVRYPKGSLKA